MFKENKKTKKNINKHNKTEEQQKREVCLRRHRGLQRRVARSLREGGVTTVLLLLLSLVVVVVVVVVVVMLLLSVSLVHYIILYIMIYIISFYVM